jgi:hypothetical protein
MIGRRVDMGLDGLSVVLKNVCNFKTKFCWDCFVLQNLEVYSALLLRYPRRYMLCPYSYLQESHHCFSNIFII